MTGRYRGAQRPQQYGPGNDTGHSSPAYSNLSDLENETDDFGRQLVQHAKDTQRLREALRRPEPDQQPFRKARSHPHVGLTLENLERRDREGYEGKVVDLGEDDTERSTPRKLPRYGSPRSAGSGSTASSEQPVRNSRAWGRKSRQQPDWLHRIRADEGVRAGVEDVSDIFQARQVGAARGVSDLNTPVDLDWASAAADVPLPSVEDSPLASRNTTPAGAQKNDSLEQIRELELGDDFTFGSFLASTPAAVSRVIGLDEIREREFRSARPKITTAARHDRSQGISPEVQRKDAAKVPSILEIQEKEQNVEAPTQSSRGGASADMRLLSPAKRVDPATKKTGELRSRMSPRHEPPVAVYQAAEAQESTNGVKKANQIRPDHFRHDSHDTLRRLARVASVTPSPKGTPTGAGGEVRKSSGNEVVKGIGAEEKGKPRSGSIEKQDASTGKKRLAISNTRQPLPFTDSKPMKESASFSEQYLEPLLVPKTPVVTGAWIDTPRPAGGDAEALKLPLTKANVTASSNTSPNMALQRSRPAPHRPKLASSALTAVVADAQAGTGLRDFGDSTIDSLESLIASPTLPSFDTAELDPHRIPLEGSKNKENQDGGGASASLDTAKPLAVKPHLQRSGEVQALQAMNARLRTARTSIRDARRGMRRVKARVNAISDDEDEAEWESDDTGSDSDNEQLTSSDQGHITTTKAAGQDRKRKRKMSLHQHRCRCCKEGWFEKNFRKFRRLFWRDGHWTWLGLLWWGFVLWVLVENVMCHFYCRPEYASHMVEYGLDFDAPEPPYVTTTLLYRAFIRPFAFIYTPIYILVRDVIKDTYRAFTGQEFPFNLLTQEERNADWDRRYEAAAAARKARQSETRPVVPSDHAELSFLQEALKGMTGWSSRVKHQERDDQMHHAQRVSAQSIWTEEVVGVLGQDEVV